MDTDPAAEPATPAPAPLPGTLAANIAAYSHPRPARAPAVPADRSLTEDEVARNQLVLGMQYRAWKEAELGFIKNLVKMYAAGMTKREIAIACGVYPRDAERMLDNYSQAIQEYLQEEGKDQ